MQFRKAELHAKILAAVDKEIIEHSSVDEVPFNIKLVTLGHVAFYSFTLMSSKRGHSKDEYKVQLFLPGQRRRERRQIQLASEAFTIISGYLREENIFVFWDAYAHESFSYLQSLQVKNNCVWLAQIYGISTCKRRLRGGKSLETVVTCRADYFIEGIRARMNFSAQRTNLRTGSLWEDIV